MIRRTAVPALALVLALGATGVGEAGEVRLTIKDGRVTLIARDATLRDILVEWERVGGTRIINRDRVPATRLTLELPNVTEEQALETLLRPIAGYMAARRPGSVDGASGFSRLVLMTAPASAAAYPAPSPIGAGASSGAAALSGPPMGRPGMQRRVLPDGRVVTIMEDPQRGDDPDQPDEPLREGAPGMMRPPFNAPPRQEAQTGGDQPPPTYVPGQAIPGTATAPGMPATVSTPGGVAAKPGTPPPPIKPPGDGR